MYISEMYMERDNLFKELFYLNIEVLKVLDDIRSALRLYKNPNSIQYTHMKTELINNIGNVIEKIEEIKDTPNTLPEDIKQYYDHLYMIKHKQIGSNYDFLKDISPELMVICNKTDKILRKYQT